MKNLEDSAVLKIMEIPLASTTDAIRFIQRISTIRRLFLWEMKHIPFVVIISICLIFTGSSAAKTLSINYYGGIAAAARLHYSNNSFQLAPGPAVALVVSPGQSYEIEGKFHAGSLFGYDLTASFTGRYCLTFKAWRPACGLQFSCSGGNVIFHRSGPDYIIPPGSEWGIGIELIPARFASGAITVSFFECSIGTDLQNPGRVLLLDASVLRLNILFGTKKDAVK